MVVRVVLQLTFLHGSASPLLEPSIENFFGAPAEGSEFIPVERVRAISPEDLDRRVRDGKPFIIEDAGRDNPLVGIGCDEYACQ